MPNLRQQIATRIMAASANDIQKLAEAYARIEYPARFRNLVSYGSNTDGQAISGWPDAWVMTDGRLDAVEATRGDWKTHIQDDLDKAGKSKISLRGLIYFAPSPKGRCSSDEMRDWKAKFAELGIPPENVDIVVGNDAIERLARPAYARARWEWLAIEPTPRQFKLVTWSSEFGSGAFQPTRSEYIAGLVHRPALTDAVESRLQEKGWAVVLGRGASGKTVLAHILAFSETYREYPTFLYDAAGTYDSAISNQLASDLVEFGHKRALFILDNIHLNDQLTQDVHNAWVNAPERPVLLLLGRETRRQAAMRFPDGDSAPLILQAQYPEVLGVYRRLLARSVEPGARLEDPPEGEVLKWVRTFGGDPARPTTSVDLMALSAAILRRQSVLLSGRDWKLSEEHARDQIRVQYLQRLSDGERRNVLRLASLPEDSRLADTALADPIAGFSDSLRQGFVFEVAHRTRQSLRYHFVHSALARLIGQVASPMIAADERTIVATLDPDFGITLARSLARDGDAQAAGDVLRAIFRTDWLLRYESAANTLIMMFRQFLNDGLLSKADIDHQLSRPEISIYLGKLSLQSLASLVLFCEQNELKNGIIAIFNFFHANMNVVAGRCLKISTLEKIINFLRMLESRKQFNLYNMFIGTIASSTELLSEVIWETPIGDVVPYIDYVTKYGTANVFVKTITREYGMQPDRLAQACRKCPLDQLAALLRALDKPNFRTVRSKLIASLANSSNLQFLVDKVYDAPAAEIIPILDNPELGTQIAPLIERERWDESRSGATSELMPYFSALTRRLSRLQRADLSVALARNLVLTDRREGGAKDLYFPGFIHALRLSELDHAEYRDFLVKVASPEWLETQYANATALTIVAGLFWVVSNFPDKESKRIFLHPGLEARVIEMFSVCSADAKANWVEGLGLLGVFGGLGGDCARIPMGGLPQADVLAEVLGGFSAGDDGRISIPEFQIWRGMYELAYVVPDRLRIEASAGPLILGRFRANLPFASPMGATWRILAWLELCEKSDWLLVKPAVDLSTDMPFLQTS